MIEQRNFQRQITSNLLHPLKTAAKRLARTEGIIPALESAHAVAEAIARAPSEPGKVYLVNLSGRGDKDTDIYRENLPELDAADTNPTTF